MILRKCSKVSRALCFHESQLFSLMMKIDIMYCFIIAKHFKYTRVGRKVRRHFSYQKKYRVVEEVFYDILNSNIC